MTTSPTVDSATCAYCGQRKPADEFPPNVNKHSGLDSYCSDCQRKYRQDYDARNYENQRLRPHSPFARRASDALESGEPLEYSRAVCDHVSWYVQRKIAEFETLHRMEAPPHMTAILTIAKSVSAQHPKKRRAGRVTERETYVLRCTVCETEHEARSPIAKYCNGCRVKVRREQRKAQHARWRLRPAGQESLKRKQERQNVERAAERAARLPVVIECQRCGVHVEAKTRHRKYCVDCVDQARREYALAYNAAYRKTEKGRALHRAGNRAYKQRKREAARATSLDGAQGDT